MSDQNRRSFISSMASFLCAPAIVRASSLMPVSCHAMLELECITGAMVEAAEIDVRKFIKLSFKGVPFYLPSYS
jgi:hypothetical protein